MVNKTTELTKKELALFNKFTEILSQMQPQSVTSMASPLYPPYIPSFPFIQKEHIIEEKKNKKKKHNGLTYLTKSMFANPYVVSLMKYIYDNNIVVTLNHTQVLDNGNIYTTYPDVTLLLRKYLEYNGLIDKNYIQLDSFIWDLLGFDFTEEMIREKKIIENGGTFIFVKSGKVNSGVQKLASVIFKRM